MTLAFSTHFPTTKPEFNNQPTNFVPKILAGYFASQLASKGALVSRFRKFPNDLSTNFQYCDTLPKMWKGMHPKIHTMRSDKKQRWAKGKLIHPVINNRTKKRFQFAPTATCTGTQKVQIRYFYREDESRSEVTIKVDGVALGFDESKELALNDGFDNLQQFLWWFDEDWEGYIIHWTNYRYGKAKDCEVISPRMVKPIEFLPVSKADLKVLQSTIKEVREAENELLNEVIKQHLGRSTITESDIGKFSKAIVNNEPGKYEYQLWFDSKLLGNVTGNSTDAGGVEFVFKLN